MLRVEKAGFSASETINFGHQYGLVHILTLQGPLVVFEIGNWLLPPVIVQLSFPVLH